MTGSARSNEQSARHAVRRAQAPDEALHQLRALVAAANVGLWDWDLETGTVTYSTEWKRQIGYDEHEISNAFSEWESRVHPDDLEQTLRRVRAYIDKPSPSYEVEFRFRHKDGSYRWILTQASLALDEQDKPIRVLGSHIDITDKKLAETALHEQEARLRAVVDAVPHLIAILSPADAQVEYANRAWRDYFGSATSWATPGERVGLVHPDERNAATATQANLRADISSPAASRVGGQSSQLFRLRGSDDIYRWFSCQSTIVNAASGMPEYIIATATNVEDLKRSESSLREAHALLQAALRVGGIGTLVWEVQENELLWGDSLLQLLGWQREEVAQCNAQRLLERVHPDDRDALGHTLARALQCGRDYTLECRVIRGDGKTIWLAAKGQVERDEHESPKRMVTAFVDVTQRKQLESELLQAQKMEALGQLAGGVAHDFNNLLTVILGQVSRLEARLNLPADIVDALEAIEAAASRAAGLTAQLLAFGRRQRQHVQNLDLNVVIADTVRLLRRLVGASVTITLAPWPTPLFVHADPTMLTQVVLNLGVNARDAMEARGQCTFRTNLVHLDEVSATPIAGAHAGDWACLAVSDTGSGIPPAVFARLFEPFFTTKGAGKGTGLGLSTVFNIVKQHNGFITVDTVLGQGSTFKVFFPLSTEQKPVDVPTPSTPSPRIQRARILLVEDEPRLRTLMLAILEDHNYEVTAAADATEALHIWREQHKEFDLLVTDMTMPGIMTGYELATLLGAEKPSLRAILCSGGNLDGGGEREGATSRLTFLQKPWTAGKLWQAVQSALE